MRSWVQGDTVVEVLALRAGEGELWVPLQKTLGAFLPLTKILPIPPPGDPGMSYFFSPRQRWPQFIPFNSQHQPPPQSDHVLLYIPCCRPIVSQEPAQTHSTGPGENKAGCVSANCPCIVFYQVSVFAEKWAPGFLLTKALWN